jgi:hypothetical protein
MEQREGEVILPEQRVIMDIWRDPFKELIHAIDACMTGKCLDENILRESSEKVSAGWRR